MKWSPFIILTSIDILWVGSYKHWNASASNYKSYVDGWYYISFILIPRLMHSIPLHKAVCHFFFKIRSLLNSSNQVNPLITKSFWMTLQVKLLDPEKWLIHLLLPGLAHFSESHLGFVVQTKQNILVDLLKSRIANDKNCFWFYNFLFCFPNFITYLSFHVFVKLFFIFKFDSFTWNCSRFINRTFEFLFWYYYFSFVDIRNQFFCNARWIETLIHYFCLELNFFNLWNFEWGVSFQRVEWNDNQSRPDKISTNCQIFDIDIFSIRCWRPGLFMIPFFYFRRLLRELNNFRDTYKLIWFLNLQVNISNLSNSNFFAENKDFINSLKGLRNCKYLDLE